MSEQRKGVFRMKRMGVVSASQLSPWLRFCIGVAILALAITPLVMAVRWW